MSPSLVPAGLFPLAAIYLATGGLAVWASLRLALHWLPPRRARLRWGLAVAAFALAAVAPLLLLAHAVWAQPAAVSLAGAGVHGIVGPEPGLLAVEPVDEPTAWLSWLVVGEPARDFATLWLAGLVVLALRGAVATLRLRLVARAWRPAPAELRRRLDWPAGFALRVGERGMPLAHGWRGTAFLPLWLFRELDQESARQVARHELAHLRWRDPAVDLSLRMVRTLLWPSLPLWLLERRVRRECEAAADREAIAGERSDPLAYAETLLGVARNRRGWAPALGATGSLEERVHRLVAPAAPARAWRIAVTVALLVAGVGLAGSLPLPTWRQGAFDERAHWGPLDHALGYNPVIRSRQTEQGWRVRVQGRELTDDELRRWQGSRGLAERVEIVHAAEARPLAAEAEARRPRDGP